MSNKEIFDFLTSNSCLFNFWMNARVYKGFHGDKNVEEHWSTVECQSKFNCIVTWFLSQNANNDINKNALFDLGAMSHGQAERETQQIE